MLDHAEQAAITRPREPFRLAEQMVIIALIVTTFLLFAPIVYQMIRQATDYGDHLRDAIYLADYGKTIRPRPHILYHLLIVAVHRLSPNLTVGTIGLLLGIVLYTVTSLALYGWFRAALKSLHDRPLLFAFALPLVALILAPVTLPTWHEYNLYLGYIVTSTYHNPTVVLLKPLALLLFWRCVHLLTYMEREPLTLHALTAALTALCVLAKPNYALCLLPVLALVGVYRLVRRQPLRWMALALTVALPGALVLAYQYFAYETSSLGSFVFAPLEFMGLHDAPPALVFKLLCSILFPLVVMVAFPRQAAQDRPLMLAWCVFGVSAFQTYFLIERGLEQEHGNFLWGGQIALFIVFVTALSFFVRQTLRPATDNEVQRRTLIVLCLAVLTLHILCGILWYIVHVTGQFHLYSFADPHGWW